MSTLEVLTDAKQILLDSGWCKGVTRNKDGEYCALGAICHAAHRESQPHSYGEFILAAKALGTHIPGHRAISTFNDHPDTTITDVLAVFDRAIAAEQAKQ